MSFAKARRGLAAAALLFLANGCEYVVSDVATRIRYALNDARIELQQSEVETLTIALKPNHLPDACPGGSGYRVVLSPYKGNKQVAVGDIDVHCQRARHYWTGFGSEGIYVTRVLSVEKKADDELRITLRKTPAGVEIVSLD